jgi:hypothetical protein
MDYNRLFSIADGARTRRGLARDDIAFVRDDVPERLVTFPRLKKPARISHPSGFSISGAPVGTFVKSALLMAGQGALGRRYAGSPFYERVEADLALHIMRSHFHHGYPKGTHCCVPCTLAVLPALEMSAIRYFDSRALAMDVRALIAARGWRFATEAPNARMLRWALSGPGTM